MNTKQKDSRQFGRLRLFQLRERTELAAEQMDAERPRFEALARNESAPRAVSSFNLFQTPADIAELMAEQFTAEHLRGNMLEPSAGLGRLFHAIRSRKPSAHITLIENAPQIAAELYRMTKDDPAAVLLQRDFLAVSADDIHTREKFSAVIMNPPFKNGTDIKHIKHAAQMLAPGGRLVALCANGPRQNATLKPIADHWRELPAGSFKSEGTGVNVVMLIIDK